MHYPLASDARSLVWLANQNSITPHVWSSRVPKLHQPDLCVFDLDPAGRRSRGAAGGGAGGAGPARRAGAALLRQDVGLEGLPHRRSRSTARPTSRSSGASPTAPGAVLVKRHPELLTQEFIKADRAGRILVDTGRNGPGATFAAVYAVRPKPGAPVSAPCTWQEIEREAVGPRTFTLRNMADRIGEVGDLWQGMDSQRRSLQDAMTALQRLLTEADWAEAMAASTRRPVSRKRSKAESKPAPSKTRQKS